MVIKTNINNIIVTNMNIEKTKPILNDFMI